MSKFSNEFILFIDDERSNLDWRHQLAATIRLRDLEREHGNFADMVANEDFDRTKCGDAVDGYLYYPWMLQCSPVRTRPEEDQIRLARWLRDILVSLGCVVVVAANFEDRL